MLARLRQDPRVRYASVPRAVHATSQPSTPNDPCYVATCLTDTNPPQPASDSGYLNAVGAPAAWAVTHGDGVKVAVLDSGVDASHEDLSAKIDPQTDLHNYCPDDPACHDTSQVAEDDNGHGTHVAGIVAAVTDNSKGVASLGWGVGLDIYKVLDSQGDGNTFDVANAIYAAVSAGDRVINMSLSDSPCIDPSNSGPDPDEYAAVEYALAHNVVVVAAAGNDACDKPAYPASYPGVLSVAATDNNGVVQAFSEWGPAANIAAPGVDILSTWNDGGYHEDTGTSMSAPQVAAAAALMLANGSSLTAPQVTALLEADANPVSPSGNPIDGGMLDVPAALAGEASPPNVYDGYDMAGSDGSVYPFGSSIYAGDLAGTHLNQPVVGITRTADGLGYWLVAKDGGIFNFGDAGYFGSTGNIRLNAPIVGMAEDPLTHGYWLVAADGGIFNFNAPYLGSMGGSHLNQPVVGMAATPTGNGYWLVAADGGIFNFGDAGYFGSTGSIRLNQPVVGMAGTSTGRGYWLVARDGGIFNFGDAGYFGSTGAIRLNQPVVGMAADPGSAGYWLVAADGGIFNFGDARFHGSLGGVAIPAPVVSGSS